MGNIKKIKCRLDRHIQNKEGKLLKMYKRVLVKLKQCRQLSIRIKKNHANYEGFAEEQNP